MVNEFFNEVGDINTHFLCLLLRASDVFSRHVQGLCEGWGTVRDR